MNALIVSARPRPATLAVFVDVVPVDDFYPVIERADAAIGDTATDDVLYLACAIASDAAIRSDDSDFDEQNLVEPGRELGGQH